MSSGVHDAVQVEVGIRLGVLLDGLAHLLGPTLVVRDVLCVLLLLGLPLADSVRCVVVQEVAHVGWWLLGEVVS